MSGINTAINSAIADQAFARYGKNFIISAIGSNGPAADAGICGGIQPESSATTSLFEMVDYAISLGGFGDKENVCSSDYTSALNKVSTFVRDTVVKTYNLGFDINVDELLGVTGIHKDGTPYEFDLNGADAHILRVNGEILVINDESALAEKLGFSLEEFLANPPQIFGKVGKREIIQN